MNVPYFSGETVVLVHGLWMNGTELSMLGHRLRHDHGFDVRRYSYPTLRGDVAAICADLAEFAAQAGGTGRVHLVGHSLGGLMVYRTLTECAVSIEGNAVLLGAPLNGSKAARGASRWPMLRPLLGPHVLRELVEPRGRCWSGGQVPRRHRRHAAHRHGPVLCALGRGQRRHDRAERDPGSRPHRSPRCAAQPLRHAAGRRRGGAGRLFPAYWRLSQDRSLIDARAGPEALHKVEISRKIITADALHTQKALSAQIIKQGGNYVLPVKGNQLRLYQNIQQLFAPDYPKPGFGKIQTDFLTTQTVSKGHGRLETRILTTSEMLNAYSTWPGLAQVYRLERQFPWGRSGRCYRTSNEVEFGITSLSRTHTSPARLLKIRRAHWGIETGLHGRRDVTFKEDATRMTVGNILVKS